MKIPLSQTEHIAQKVAIDLNKSGMVTMTQGMDSVVEVAHKILLDSSKKEAALDEHVEKIVSENEDRIDEFLADERQLFWMIKKRLAPEFGVLLSDEEKISDVSHKILDELYDEDLIFYDVSENRLKNIIYDAIHTFLISSSEIQDIVYDRLKSYKRELIPGTDDYEILYEKFYKEELVKRGMA